MTKYIPPGFPKSRVIKGLHQAMGFGEPTRAGDKATFYFPKGTPVDTGMPVDEDSVPFDPDAQPTYATKPPVKVPCAIEYFERGDINETFGTVKASRIKITLLDEDYQRVKGFSYVAAGGDKYVYDTTPPSDALASIDVWTVWCIAEDEA